MLNFLDGSRGVSSQRCLNSFQLFTPVQRIDLWCHQVGTNILSIIFLFKSGFEDSPLLVPAWKKATDFDATFIFSFSHLIRYNPEYITKFQILKNARLTTRDIDSTPLFLIYIFTFYGMTPPPHFQI